MRALSTSLTQLVSSGVLGFSQTPRGDPHGFFLIFSFTQGFSASHIHPCYDSGGMFVSSVEFALAAADVSKLLLRRFHFDGNQR